MDVKMVGLARTEDIAIFGGTDGKIYPVSLQAADDRDMPFRGPGEPERLISTASLVLFEGKAHTIISRVYCNPIQVGDHVIRCGYSRRRNCWVVRGEKAGENLLVPTVERVLYAQPEWFTSPQEAHNATER